MEPEDKDRRKFLGEAAALASLSVFPSELLAQASPEQKEAITGGPGWLKATFRVIEWNPVDLPDGQEISCMFEVGGQRIRGYWRRVDAGRTYSIFHYTVLPGGKAQLGVINGTKGELQGDDRRWDTIQLTRIEPDGAVVRQQPSVMPVLTGNLYEGLAPQEAIDQFLRDKAEGRFK